MALGSAFTWGAGGSKITPEQLALAKQVMARKNAQGVDTSPVGHWAAGAARIADALGDVFQEKRLSEQEKELNAYNEQAASPLIDALSGSSSPMASASTSGVAQEMAQTSPTGDSSGILPASFLAAVDRTEGAGGYDTLYGHAQKNGPFAGTSISSMPIKDALAFADPSGAYGQSVKGQIGRVATPMGRYQIVGTTLKNAVGALGLDPNAPFDQRAQDSVAAYLAKQRVASADTLPGKISALRSEWHGFKSVPDNQMAQIVADLERGGTQMASASPAAAAIETVAPQSGYVDPMVSVQPQAMPQASFDAARFGEAPASPMMMAAPEVYSAQTDFAPELAPPVNVGPATPVAAVQQPQVTPQPQAPATNTAAIAQALRVMSDPRANEGTRRVAQVLLQQEQQKQAASQEQSVWQQRQQYEQQQQNSDPLRQLQIQKAQQELAGGSRQSLVNAGDGRIYDPNSQQWITAPDAASRNFRQATPDEVKAFGTNGQVGPDGKFYPITPPQGTALSVDPTTGAVTFNQGAGVKPLTEAQSKDSFFTTRMTAATPTIDKFEGALMSLPEAAAGAIPMNLGRYAQSEEYQLAKDAGRDFVNAYLRKDSGAALTAQEEANYGQLLLPQPGDKPAILAAKRQRRQIATEAIKSGMPPSAVDGMLKAIQAVPGADKPAETTSEKKTRTGVQWSID